MRFSKHVLPIAILLTGVIAAKDESTTAVEKAKATDDKASETTADDSKTADATEEASATATSKDDKKDSKTNKSDTKTGSKEKSAASQTSADGPTITWDPPAPKTTIPDINAGSPSPMTPGVVVLSLVLGITSLGMALL
ncbi:hypothetical protein IL306_004363 [Fusarium sp. DS 682]|nr:hypothetical protein IL306_004363 [Fusarium sp. DS 682]